MDTTTAQERLAGPEWLAFIEGLGIALADYAPEDPRFWRAIELAKAPLFEGLADEDAEVVEAAVRRELESRGLAGDHVGNG